MTRTFASSAITACGACAVLLLGSNASAEPAPLSSSSAGTDTIFEPQLLSLSGSLGNTPLGNVSVSAISGRVDERQVRAASFAVPGISISQSIWSSDAFNLSLAPALEFANSHRSAAYDELTLALPLSLGGALQAVSWSNELAYRATAGTNEVSMDASVQVEVVPAVSIGAGLLLIAPPTLESIQAQLSTSLSWQPDDALSLSASVGRGLRDTPFEQDEDLAVASMSLML